MKISKPIRTLVATGALSLGSFTAVMSATSATAPIASASPRATTSLCPTVVPGYGCNVSNGAGLSGLDAWTRRLLNSYSRSGRVRGYYPSAYNSSIYFGMYGPGRYTR